MNIARDHLGEEAFTAAWEQGQELSLEQAISLVEDVATESARHRAGLPDQERDLN
jgi:hypothetical protein